MLTSGISEMSKVIRIFVSFLSDDKTSCNVSYIFFSVLIDHSVPGDEIPAIEAGIVGALAETKAVSGFKDGTCKVTAE